MRTKALRSKRSQGRSEEQLEDWVRSQVLGFQLLEVGR